MALDFSPSLSSTQAQVSLLGPVDRVSFFDEQKRNRRATWRLVAACGFAVVAMGIPLSIVLTPFVFALALTVAHVLDVFFISVVLQGLMSVTAWIGAVLDYFLDGNGPQYSLASLFFAVGLVLLPGMGTVAALWFSINSFFRHAGVGGVLLSLGARTPRLEDLEEQQLANLVTEMALAAGVPPPRVMLLDSPVANAAAIGSSPEDATIIVSRRVLDEFDRDETQGLIGHLVGSISNGDLRIAFLMGAVFLTFGLLVTLLDTPFGPRSRGVLRQLFDLAFRRQRYDHSVTEAETLSRLLTQGLQMEGKDDLDTFTEKQEGRPLYYLLLPVLMTNLSVKLTLFVFISFLVGPLIALLWRSRCYLADATAVQLTRNPDGVARGLQGLANKGAMIPGSQWIAHLFIIGPETAKERGEAAFSRTMKDFQQQGKTEVSLEESKRLQQALQQLRAGAVETRTDTFEKSLGAGSFIAFRPPLSRRFERLRTLGATVVTWRRQRSWEKLLGIRQTLVTLGPIKGALMVGLFLLLAVLIPIAVGGLFVVMAMLTMLSVMIMSFWLALIYGCFSLLGFLTGLLFG
jgi:Zn-dependent protease with chaperone function